MKPDDRIDPIRANIYSFLASLLIRPPAARLLLRLEQIGHSASGRDSLDQAWRLLGKASGKTSPMQLEDEFNRLFVNIGGEKVLPYASWYLSGCLLGKPLARLRDDLTQMGVQLKADVQESEDHVAAICEIMALICSKAILVEFEDQHIFFNRHLASWMPGLFADIQKSPQACFYRAVGRLGEVFMEFENFYLEQKESIEISN